MDTDMIDEASVALRQDLTCRVCQDIFRDPVSLPCSHSFCRDCLHRSWQVNKKCQVCRKGFTEDQAIANRDLRNACETFVKQTNWKVVEKPSEFNCYFHNKPLELFCELDQKPVCVDCATLHSTHRLFSLKDGVPLCKSELNEKVEFFERKLDLYKKTRQKLNKTVECVKQQVGDAEKQIKEEFERLHSFLYAEEITRREALAAEEKEKITTLQERISTTEEYIKTLQEHVDTLKQELSKDDLPFLMNFQNIKIQTHWSKKEPQIHHHLLLDMRKHVGALGFNIWKNMKEYVNYYPVVFDPNSASPWLALSPDLTSLKESPEPLSVPDTPERFDPCVFVLGAEGYTTGKHKWEINVGDNPKWIVGVCRESVPRKKKFTVSTNRGVWAIGLSKEQYTVFTPEHQVLPVDPRPEKIRVKLNMDKREVSFYDGGAEKHLVSFTYKLDKGEKLYPMFGPGLHSTPMVLVPGKIVIHTS